MKKYNVLNAYSDTYDMVDKLKKQSGDSVVNILEKAINVYVKGVKKMKKSDAYKKGYEDCRKEMMEKLNA